MHLRQWIKSACLIMMMVFSISVAHAQNDDDISIDRTKLVSQQIELLKSRSEQANQEYARLQTQREEALPPDVIEKSSKSLLDKASLEISVSNSNLESINIELADTQQTITWLEKNIQELTNQLNVITIFGAKVASSEVSNAQSMRSSLVYQQKLLELEKVRLHYLQTIQATVTNILQLNQERLARLNVLLKSHKLFHLNQQEVSDELVYQEQQNNWLKKVNQLYLKLSLINPLKNKAEYAETEREIFYANENANFAYIQSLISRYKDQIQQIKLAANKNNSIGLLNDMSDQAQQISKQIDQLSSVLQTRMGVLQKHINYLLPRKNTDASINSYIAQLTGLIQQYKTDVAVLAGLDKDIAALRTGVDKLLQTELSQRQGLPSFSSKMLLDLGREALLVPILTFQMIKSMSSQIFKTIQSASAVMWSAFFLLELGLAFGYYFAKKYLQELLVRPSAWRDQLNIKWIGLQWVSRNLLDLFFIFNLGVLLYAVNIPMQSFYLIMYLSIVWLVFKSILLLARLCFTPVLYRYSKWLILITGLVTGLTVFMHALPLIYELKVLFDRLFLFFTLIISMVLLWSWRALPNFVLSQMDVTHPYIERSVRLFGFFIPFLIFLNSLLGLIGFLNFVITVTWYEGIFLLVLVGYIILRGLLAEGFHLLLKLVMEYTANGWLWSEAFIKPIYRVLHITLFLLAGAVLFVLYGWDNESPIVERFTRLLHHKIITVLNTDITPFNIIELVVVISIFYWLIIWSREFMYRLLSMRTRDMGIRNSLAVLTQYAVIVLGVFLCLRVLGIDFRALAVVGGMFALGVGLGLKDLINNFACGFLILVERPLRVGDIVNVGGVEGEVVNIGGRAVTIQTWDRMEMLVPNTEIFNKPFINWTGRDNLVRSVFRIKISRYDNPHAVEKIIRDVLAQQKELQRDPPPQVYLTEMNDALMEFEARYYLNVKKVESRSAVLSTILSRVWDAFNQHGIKPPAQQQEIIIRKDLPSLPQ
jgi:potassium efflux system protein